MDQPPQSTTMTWLDGNSLAGPLADLFTVDITTANTTCVGCGNQARVAELRVYVGGPGIVARCASCDHVIARYTRIRDLVYLDLTGTAALTINLADND